MRSRDMIVQLACAGLLLLFVGIWVLLEMFAK
jgi:hypothetical protein